MEQVIVFAKIASALTFLFAVASAALAAPKHPGPASQNNDRSVNVRLDIGRGCVRVPLPQYGG